MSGQPTVSSQPHRLRLWLGIFLLGLAFGLMALTSRVIATDNPHRSAIVLTLNGAVGPATADYIVRGIEQAARDQASVVILSMDTPGGLMESMRHIISTILSSPIPVVTYVSPAGARAASAGTYILYGSHVAAMAPTTHLGSATPVQMGGLPGTPDDTPQSPTDQPGDGKQESPSSSKPTTQGSGSAMEHKVLEDAVSYIRELARRYGRNADWAERAVRDAVNLGAQDALAQKVIDVVATDLDDLLSQLDGRTVVMASGRQTLHTTGLEIHRLDPDWRTDLLAVITDPNVAYFLMIIGFYGIIFELASPGSLFPGVIGGICLILALFAFQVLSVNYAGLALILLGLSFIVGEAFMPSFGVLGIGGVIAFIVGSVILMDGSNQAISLPIIGGTAAVAGGFILWTVMRFVSLRRRPAASGLDQMIREPAIALDTFTAEDGYYAGHVSLTGERWNAVSESPVRLGDPLRVTSIDGLTVRVMVDRTLSRAD